MSYPVFLLHRLHKIMEKQKSLVDQVAPVQKVFLCKFPPVGLIKIIVFLEYDFSNYQLFRQCFYLSIFTFHKMMRQ